MFSGIERSPILSQIMVGYFYTKYLIQKTKIRYLNIRKRNELMVKNRKRRLRSVILFILENETVLYSGNSNIRAIKLFIKLVSSDFF